MEAISTDQQLASSGWHEVNGAGRRYYLNEHTEQVSVAR
jgi:hypothetical protein